jgi:lipopolysaccharide export system permease protein
MFIFIFQTIWLFIDDLAGKGLDFIIIAKFLFYLLPDLTEKVLPLTVLLASIITFGTFAENYEFAAMKASGMSLQRAMRILAILVSFLGILTFFFANNVIPVSQQKIYNLRRNIATVKPAAVIEEGIFSDFEGMNIKVNKKYGDNDRYLDQIIIHKKSRLQRNTTVIKAKSGELISSEGSDIVQLVLKDGHYYEDVVSRSGNQKRNFPFAKAEFETYALNIEIPDDEKDLEEERNVRTDKMKNIGRLIRDIDSLEQNNKTLVRAFSENMVERVGIFNPLQELDSIDTKIRKKKRDQIRKKAGLEKTLEKIPVDSVRTAQDIVNLYPEFQQSQLLATARNKVANMYNSVSGKKNDFDRRYKIYNMHILSLHKKYALGLSCIILFFVGAPLGAIIRKGGIGLPLVIAIIIFLSYYFIGVFAGNYSKEGNIHPILGAWLSTIIILPLGIFLTRKATADRGLTDFSFLAQRLRSLFRFRKKNDQN